MEIDIQSFVDNVAGQFDDLGDVELKPETDFRAIPDWSSLVALSIIAMVNEEYDVILTGDDVKNAHTIQDLYNATTGKM